MNPTWRPDAPPNFLKLAVARCLSAEMDRGRWLELELLADTDAIRGHHRLLRSLSFGDDDYDGNVADVVPAVLGERPVPEPDTWDPQGATPPEPLTPHDRFPNLDAVSDFISLPAWLAEHDTHLLNRLFVTDADAALPDGTVLTAVEATAARLEVTEMRRQVERIRRDHATDPEAAVGQAKELIETVCKTILGLGADDEGSLKFPQLLKRTLLRLGIDPTQQEGADAVQVRATQELVGGISKVLNGADALRNARGTGHGRSRSPMVDDGLARLVVASALAAAVFLAETFEAQTAGAPLPLVGAVPAPPEEPVPLKVGHFVLHDTFGEGRVMDVGGEPPNEAATVEFAGDVGSRRFLLRYAGLKRYSASVIVPASRCST